MSDMTEAPAIRYPFAVLADCAQREVRWRRKVYPNRILTGRMSAVFARDEIDKMTAIAGHFVELAKKERLL